MRRHQKQRFLERLESRTLLAADLIAHWQAQQLSDTIENGAPVAEWTDTLGAISARAAGEPRLAQTALGGRAGVRFDPSDGSDVLNVSSPSNPLAGALDFSVAVVFTTNSTSLTGDNGNWFEGTALVDSNTLGFSTDWGISINALGQLGAGIGGGFGNSPTNLYSEAVGLNDGQTHWAIFSRSGSEISLKIDDLPPVTESDASIKPLSALDLSFGAHEKGGNAFDGFLGEVLVYNNALDAVEIATLHSEFVGRYDNQAPQAVDDDYTLEEDGPFLFIVNAETGVLANDSDPESDTLTATLVDGPQNGKLTFNENGSFFYDPHDDFFGVDTFTYSAVDFRPSAAATVTLNVTPVHDGVVIHEDAFKSIPSQTLTVDATQGVLANDENPDLAELTVVLEQDVANGRLELNADGSFSYDPMGYAGVTAFSYRVNDGVETTDPATVTFTVNTPPTAVIDSYPVDEDTSLIVSAADGLRANDSDADGDATIVQLVETTSNGVLAVTNDGSFIYDPQEDFFGTDQFTYRLSDGVDDSQDAVVTISVQSVNDVPLAAQDGYFTLPGRTLVVPVDRGLLNNDVDVDSGSLKAVLVAGPGNSVLKLADDGSFELTPNAGFVGEDEFTYVADDGMRQSNPTTVRISVSTQPLVINEILAVNGSGLETRIRGDAGDDFRGDADTPDWIELKNLVNDPLDISGMHLTDDVEDPTKWTFPEGTVIPPEGLLLVFASGDDIRDPQLDENQALHTNFGISPDGDYLAVMSIRGDVIHEIRPGLPPQVVDVSYGLLDDSFHYFDSPSPGSTNVNGLTGIVADTSFSVDRGYFSTPFDLQVTTATPGATLVYTTDGTEPSLTVGIQTPAPAADQPPVLTLPITATTILRVAAFKDGYVPTNTDTQTYFFASDIVQQSDMWSTITEHAEWGGQLQDSLLSLPTISLVLDERISATREQQTSVELIFPDGTEGFQIDAGVEHYGGHSLNSPKKNMRLSFKSIYGDSRLKYDLFGGDAADEFDQLLLRTGSHDTWFWTHPDGGIGTYVRNRWAFDRQLEMGHLAPHGRYVQVYINGEYWGLHHAMERPNASFMASYLGGDASDYDALNAGTPIDGDSTAWRALQSNEVIDDYETLQQYLDVENYADYMLLQFYSGNDWDWNHTQNWAGARKREPGAGYVFFSWDSDVMLRTNHNADVVNKGGPGNLWNVRGGVKQHEEFLMLMADRAHNYFFNGGMFTDERLRQDIDDLADQVRLPVVAETARWGRRGFSGLRYTPDEWQKAVDWIKDVYAPQNRAGRAETVLRQLRRYDVYPAVDAPEYTVNGARQHGGDAGGGDVLDIVASGGTVYYTRDGSDPRLPGGSVNPIASIYSGTPIVMGQSFVMKGRVLEGGEWSALSEAEFLVDTVTADVSNVRISEVNYHPANPSDSEVAAGVVNDDDFEFIELVNVSDQTIDLSGVRLERVDVAGDSQGVEFDFANSDVTMLGAGEYLVVVEDLDAFQIRYGTDVPVAGQWSGGLSNLQEQITLSAGGEKIHQFTYRDTWYPATDGAGRTLEANDLTQDLADWSQRSGWRVSPTAGGSPGEAASLADITGDSNRDGVFDSSDLILIFQAGEYEDGVAGNSIWEDGDWDGDGEFGSSDLVLAFQAGNYQAAAAAKLEMATRDLIFDEWTAGNRREIDADGDNQEPGLG